jgi:hypothetical protein
MGWWTQNELTRTKEWTSGVGLIRKPSQKIGVGLDMPSLRNSKKAMYVRRLKMIVLAPS